MIAAINEVRKILTEYHVHLQPANLQRLYLPRKELGRGLSNVVHKSERIELQLFQKLYADIKVSLRRAAILREAYAASASLALIEPYLVNKYGISEGATMESLERAQKEGLYNEIKNKSRHEKLYRVTGNGLMEVESSALWLTKGKINARDEAHLSYLQDRNLFGGMPGMCPYCNKKVKSAS